MSAHTSGKLTIGRFGSAHGGPFIEYVNGSAQDQVFLTVPMQEDDHVENARRLVACWNALERFPTEHIEQYGEGIGELSVTLLDTRKALIAARALLAEVPDSLSGLDDQRDGLADRIRALLNGGAA